MQRTQDDPVAVDVEKGQGETLIPARILERIEPDKTHSLDRKTRVSLQRLRSLPKPVHAPGDGKDALQVGLEDRLEAALVRPAGEAVEARRQATRASPQDHDDGDKTDDENRQGGRQGTHMGADDRVDIDGTSLRSGYVECSAASSPDGSSGPPMLSFVPRRASGGDDDPASGGGTHIMAKRSRSSGRPGQRRPLERPAPRGETAGSSSGGSTLTDAELARAAELEAQIVAEEKAAASSVRRAAGAASAVGARARGRAAVSSEPLSVRAAHEYAYVARDVRRIGLVASLMFGALLGLHLLINVFGVIAI